MGSGKLSAGNLTEILEGYLRWASIPSRGVLSDTPSSPLMLRNPELHVSASLVNLLTVISLILQSLLS